MTDAPHEPTGPTDPSDASINPLDWHQALEKLALFGELRQGEIIAGFKNLGELDAFVIEMGVWLRSGYTTDTADPSRIHLTDSGKRVHDGWFAGSRMPSEALGTHSRKKHFGQFANITVLMLGMPEDEGNIQFVAAADKLTYRIGATGKSANLCNLGFHSRFIEQRLLTITCTDLPVKDVEKTVAAVKSKFEPDMDSSVLESIRKMISD